MSKKSKHIPVNTLPAGTREGIVIARSSIHGLPGTKEVERPHRDNGHVFILQEKGKTYLEIDFQEHCITACEMIYIHTDQVHRVMDFEDATMISWIITTENLSPENHDLLQKLTPVNVLKLSAENFSLLFDSASLCIMLAERKKEKLYNSILKQSINTLVTLVASQYLNESQKIQPHNRFEAVTASFKLALEQHYKTIKSPAAYAGLLHISAQYLNECVSNAAGSSVSQHIQQRVVLEAKRLLHHSTKSVKEISAALGYADHSYFTRLFVKLSGMTPVAFRSKNLE